MDRNISLTTKVRDLFNIWKVIDKCFNYYSLLQTFEIINFNSLYIKINSWIKKTKNKAFKGYIKGEKKLIRRIFDLWHKIKTTPGFVDSNKII